MQTATATYRYNVSRNGRVCCRTDDRKLLCDACREQVERCTCPTCQSERLAGQRTRAPRANATTAARRLVNATMTASANAVPPPPSLTARIREQRAASANEESRPVIAAPLRTNRFGVPEPVSLRDAIMARRGQR